MKNSIYLIVFLIFSIAAEGAFACSVLKFEYALEDADAVFVGTVTDVKLSPKDGDLRPYTVSFNVSKKIKGINIPDSLEVRHIGNQCYGNILPPLFKKGQKYVVFAIKKDEKHITQHPFPNMTLDGFIQKLKQ